MKSKAFLADKKRYPLRPWFREQSFWSIAVYRFGQWNDQKNSGFKKLFFDRLYWLLFRIVETLTGISLPKEADIGPGLLIHHFGGIVIHPGVAAGTNLTLRHGVTVGERVSGGKVPVIGDDVEIGAGAIILGDITIGNGAKIGAGALVLKSVPEGGVAKGSAALIEGTQP